MMEKSKLEGRNFGFLEIINIGVMERNDLHEIAVDINLVVQLEESQDSIILHFKMGKETYL